MHCLRELRQQQISAYSIVVIDVDSITDPELEEMHHLGARGIRLNFQAGSQEIDVSKVVCLLQQAAQRIRHLPGWMIQLFVPSWMWDGK